jgi:hypothetical protein
MECFNLGYVLEFLLLWKIKRKSLRKLFAEPKGSGLITSNELLSLYTGLSV